MGRRVSLPFVVILLLVVLEVLLVTNYLSLGQYKSPVVLFVIQLATPVLTAIFLATKRLHVSVRGAISWRTVLIAGPICVIGLVLAFIMASDAFARIDGMALSNSDVIPSIQVFLDRVKTGEPAYAPHYGFGYRLDPTYLPMMWAPFFISDALGIDHRMLALILLVFVIVAWTLYLMRQSISRLELAMKVALPVIALLLIIRHCPIPFALTVETLIVAYYLLLAWALVRFDHGYKRGVTIIVAIAVALCLLSRFSVLFWVPALLVVFWVAGKRKQALLVAGICGAAVLFIYVIPFLSHDWGSFGRGMDHYTRAALGEWTRDWGTGEGGQLREGTGLAVFFHDLLGGPMESRIRLLQLIHLSGSILFALIVAVGYKWLRHKIKPGLYALIGLKLYLAFFYGFIQVPYTYLFFVPIMLSVYLLFPLSMVNEKSVHQVN